MRRPQRPALLGLLAVGITALAIPTSGVAAAASSARVTGTPISAELGVKSTRTAVKVKSTKGTLTSVTASVSAPKGVVARFRSGKKTTSTVRISKLRSSKTTTLTLSLRRAGNGPTAGEVTVRLKRKGKTVGSGKVAFGPGASGPAAPPANPNSLAGRTFWGSLYGLNGTSQDSLLFLTDTMAFAGDASGKEYADGAAPPACPAVTEDCVPYSYDAKTGAFTINGKPAALKPDGGVDWDGRFYGEYAAPPAGARFDTVVTYANSFGLCPLSCTYVREDLSFLGDGRFTRDSVVSGTSPTVDFASIPPSARGVYEVRADHTIVLAFADGTQRVRTLALAKNNDGSLKTPTDGGMILGGEGYFDIRD